MRKLNRGESTATTDVIALGHEETVLGSEGIKPLGFSYKSSLYSRLPDRASELAMRSLGIPLDLRDGSADGDVSIQAVVSTFSPSSGVLSVFGDNLDNTIELARDAAGSILINDGAVPVLGGTPTVANTTLMQVFGQGGNDTIRLNESQGALPRANLFGGAGNDTLIGGSGLAMLFGQSGNARL